MTATQWELYRRPRVARRIQQGTMPGLIRLAMAHRWGWTW